MLCLFYDHYVFGIGSTLVLEHAAVAYHRIGGRTNDVYMMEDV